MTTDDEEAVQRELAELQAEATPAIEERLLFYQTRPQRNLFRKFAVFLSRSCFSHALICRQIAIRTYTCTATTGESRIGGMMVCQCGTIFAPQ